ncbi:DUF2808 domain-containing protein [Gloeobacter morelensis]|uniref:DUF2808 domain-containing protein n=1 Tax=Gloeobacter morelensis MG652769 TaxID=2781736 RepID=A0ABY3PGE0_9CYAN|nr:DUF2808 domain-containing protein [Gloeobacter morelensis]UFP92728.1 DUF2808 domain-containing protein [Gloeobacter morelensis MG652769]
MLKCSLRWLMAASLVLAAGVSPVQAQSGFCLVGCARDADLILNYKVEDRSHDYTSDRYFLWIKPQKIAVREVQVIAGPDFDGQFNTKFVEVASRTSGKSYTVEDVNWDQDLRALTVVLASPIPASEEIQLVLSQVVNPSSEGIYKLNARVLGTEPNPIYRYVGTWAITIE